jgi:chromatin assembly factor 1 subunit A
MEVQEVIEGSPQSLKRDFPYDADVISTVECTADKQHQTAPCSNEGTQPERQSTPMGSEDRTRETSTPLSSPAPTSTRTISIISTPPQLRTLPAFNGAEEPPKKRVKLTFAEKEEKRIMKEIRDREKAEEKAKREAERRFKEAEREAERVKREAEKEEKRLAKEAEKAEKEKERRAKEEERKAKEEEKEKDRKAKEEERRKKDEEKQRIEEEKQKKARLQPKLNSFFVMKTPTKKDDNPPDVASAAAVDTSSPSKTVSDKSEYAKLFPPFFVQTNVIVAPTTKFERDEQAAESLHKALDSYITGQRSPQKARPFDAAKLFRLADTRRSRGKKTVPVRTIMAQILGNKQQPIDLTTDSQLNRIRDAREQLKRVPYKILAFAEDVRPPYKGSYTIEPRIGMRKMARNPFNRGLANVNYDYDSEAEWEEPEEGEDVDLDDEEEEDLGDGDEDIAEFLDDTEDTAAVRRLAIQGDLEPVCTGICWEYGKGKGQNPELKQYRMEIMSRKLLP